jgi:methyl-accepting chemotaxis protein
MDELVGRTERTPEQDLKAQVASTIPVLGVMGTQLKETASQIELAVVEVCGKFQSMADRARAGVSGAAELLSGGVDSRSSASVESLIGEASQTIETLLRHTQDSAAVSSSAIERIKRVQEATDHIAKSLAQLDDITIGNRLLAVNARIQAVYAGDKAAGFGGVANEIGVQAKRSAEIVELIRSVSGELRDIADSALTDLQSMVVEDRKAYMKSKLEVDRVLEDFRLMHRSTREFIGKMQEEGRNVAKEIAGAVRTLQFQDRINQRIGHVVEELERIKADLSTHCADVDLDAESILQQLADSYTMHEERNVLGGGQQEISAGDVELF